MHELTGVPVAKSVVSMLSCSITCVFLVPCYYPQSVLLFSQQFKLGTS